MSKTPKPVAPQLGPAIPYGRGAKTWTSTVGKSFPLSEPLSPTMVGLLVRVDEIRMCQGRISEIAQLSDDETRKGESLWDPMMERMMMMRYCLVSAFDLAKHAIALNKDSRFRAALDKYPDQKALFADGYAALVKTMDDWRDVRSQLFAHLDVDDEKPLVGALKRHAEVEGKMTIGYLRGDFAFPLAHEVVMYAMNTTDDWRVGVKQMLETMDRANAAAFQLVWPAICAFQVLTGSFLPSNLKLSTPTL